MSELITLGNTLFVDTTEFNEKDYLNNMLDSGEATFDVINKIAEIIGYDDFELNTDTSNLLTLVELIVKLNPNENNECDAINEIVKKLGISDKYLSYWYYIHNYSNDNLI
jgi:hypothetical protein